MPAKRKSKSSTGKRPPENEQSAAATHEVILELLSSSRLAQPSDTYTEAQWSKVVVAKALSDRGIGVIAIMRALRITPVDTAFWVANLERRRLPCRAKQQATLWAAMLQQADPLKRMQAEQVVGADCLASVERFHQAAPINQPNCC